MILLQIQSFRFLARVRKPDPHRVRPHSLKPRHQPAPIRLWPHDLMRPRRVRRDSVRSIVLIGPDFGEIRSIRPSMTLHKPRQRPMNIVAVSMRIRPIAPIHFGLDVGSRIDLDHEIHGDGIVVDKQIDAKHVVRSDRIVRFRDDSRSHAGGRVVRVDHVD